MSVENNWRGRCKGIGRRLSPHRYLILITIIVVVVVVAPPLTAQTATVVGAGVAALGAIATERRTVHR